MKYKTKARVVYKRNSYSGYLSEAHIQVRPWDQFEQMQVFMEPGEQSGL